MIPHKHLGVEVVGSLSGIHPHDTFIGLIPVEVVPLNGSEVFVDGAHHTIFAPPPTSPDEIISLTTLGYLGTIVFHHVGEEVTVKDWFTLPLPVGLIVRPNIRSKVTATSEVDGEVPALNGLKDSFEEHVEVPPTFEGVRLVRPQVVLPPDWVLGSCRKAVG